MSEAFIDDSGKTQTIPDPSAIGGSDGFMDDKTRFKFKRLGEYQPGESWILMVYGASKTGKTFFSGTAGERTLFINVGDGIETLMSPAFTSRYPSVREKMIMVDIREMKPDSSADAFDMVGDAIDHAMQHFPNKFDTVILDEATGFRKVAMNKAMELNTSGRTSTVRPNRMKEYVKSDVGDYGIEMDMIEWFLAQYVPKFKGGGKNFLMLAHERQVFAKPAKIGDDAVLKRIMPGFTGKTFPDKVPAYFDDVWHSEVATNGMSESFYRLRTAGNDQELGGSRHGGIFKVEESNPNYLSMLDRIKKSQVSTTTKRK